MIATAFCGCDASDDEVVTIDRDIAIAEASGDEGMVGAAKQTMEKAEPEKKLAVYVCGAVNAPGVYELDACSRIVDAVDAAGGPGPDAGFGYINLAQPVTDGQKVYIPTEKEVRDAIESGAYTSTVNITSNTPGMETGEGGADQGGSNVGRAEAGELVDINTADAQTLMTLPGIGQSKADKIIAYREANGGFTCIEDIMLVGGIKEGLYNKVKDRICVNR